MRLTANFTLEELTSSQTAARRGWDNMPPPDILERLRLVTAPGMEKVRAALGAKVISVSSGYRSHKVNQAVGGKPTSAHLFGYAVDFNCFSYGSPMAVARRIADTCQEFSIEFDQLIYEFGRWVHISFDHKHRHQVLTIDGHGTRTGLLLIRP